MLIVRQSTARIVTVGPILNADGVAVTDGVVGDLKISKNGGAPAALNGSATLTHRHTGYYSLSLTTSDLDTVGQAEIVIDDTVNAMPVKELTVIEEAVYDISFAAGATGNVGLKDNAVSALAIADNSIDGDALTATAVNKIADQVWDELVNGHLTAGSYGQALGRWLAMYSGTVANSSATAVDLGALGISDDELNDHLVVFFDSSASDFLARWITDFDGTTSIATLDAALPAATESGVDTYVVYAFKRVTPAQNAAAVMTALNTDTFAEPGQEAPPATTTLVKKIGYLYKFLRNKVEQLDDGTLKVYADDGSTVDQKATVSDDGSTYTRGEIGSGP